MHSILPNIVYIIVGFLLGILATVAVYKAEIHRRIDLLEANLHTRFTDLLKEIGKVTGAAKIEIGDRHSLEEKALELCRKIEALPASEAQTAASIAASELRQLIADLAGHSSPSPVPSPASTTGNPPPAASPATSAS